MRNALTNVVGAGARTEVHVIEEELSGCARLVLTTDRVHGVLDERRVEQLLVEVDIRAASRNLVAAALARGSRDNCTAVVADYRSV
jgi:serine/threonine protein phosphatase PrpC